MQSEERIRQLTLVRGILNALIALTGHLRIYQQKNKVVLLALSRLELLLESFFAAHGPLVLVVGRHGFLFAGEFVDRSSGNFQKLAQTMFMHGVASVTWNSEVSEYEIVTFLRLLGRKPSESWDEGGLRGSLEDRQISGIVVTELKEQDFELREADGATLPSLAAGRNDLWDRFAMAIFQRQQAIVAGTEGVADTNDGVSSAPPPGELASQSSAFLASSTEEEKRLFVHEMGNFLVSLQHENIRTYRTSALKKLTDYVRHLSPELKQLFLQNAFNLNLKADFAEGFCSGLSDDMILDVLHNAALGKGYVPPVVLALLGKLASSRGLVSEERPLSDAVDPELELKTRELFRADEFELYVPDDYRQTLLQLVHNEPLDADLHNRLELEKVSLQPERLETHTAEIIGYLLEHEIDAQHLDGVIASLDSMIIAYAARGEYDAILALFQRCLARGPSDYQKLIRFLHAPECVGTLLDGPRLHGKEKFEELKKLILAIGFPFVVAILDRLAEENNRAIRYFYVGCLKELGATVPAQIGQRLSDPRWYYLRNLLYLLREIADPSQTAKVRPLFNHPHPKVRLEAIRTGLFFRDAVAQRMLLEQLSSKDPQVVLAALALARMSHDPKSTDRLLAIVVQGGLFDYRFERRKAAVHALAEAAPREALLVLNTLLQSRSWLHAKAHAQLKLEIVRSFERYPADLVRATLRRLAAGADDELSRAAGELLARPAGERP